MATSERFEIELPTELAEFVHSQVGQGALASDSDVLREAVRVMQQQADQVDGMRRAWTEGVASGDAGLLAFAELRTAAKSRLAGLPKE